MRLPDCWRNALTVLLGIANPTPLEPPVPVAELEPETIWELTPMTPPEESIRGPPELPGFNAASVWITCAIVAPSGALICRFTAETTPVVSVQFNPNGLPIASTPSPTSTALE